MLQRLSLHVVHDHEMSLVALSAAIAIFASLTSFVILRRTSLPLDRWRPGWLVLAGFTTGIGIWATHFTAMLGYAPGLRLGFDPLVAFASVVIAIILATAGWAVCLCGGRASAAFGGAIVGVGLASAHMIDVTSMKVNGVILQDNGLVAASILLGVAFYALAGWYYFSKDQKTFPVVPAMAMTAAILSLHFVGMSALTIVPGPAGTPTGALLDLHYVGGLVVFAAVLLLAVAAFVAFLDIRRAHALLADKLRLQSVVAALQDSEERYRLAARATSDALWVWRHADDTVEWGEGISRRFGYKDARMGTSLAWWAERIHPEDSAAVLDSLNAALAGDSAEWTAEYRFLKGDGAFADIHAQGHIVRDESGAPLHTIGAMIDITDRRRGERKLEWAAGHDPLTDLPNRLLFNARLDSFFQAQPDLGSALAIILIDIDHFKVINDTLGHAAGDALLVEAASRLRDGSPTNSMIARLGGDEFAILIFGCTNTEIMQKAEDVLAIVKCPFGIEGSRIDASASAGVSVWPQDGASPSELLKAADLALYAAKADGRAAVRRFQPEMRSAIDLRAKMLSDARKALDDNNVVPFYQPKIDLVSGELIGLEALLRWHHSDHGLQSPAKIAAAFEDLDLSARLTDRMVDKVLSDMRRWLDQGLEFGNVAINGSAADFRVGNFGEKLLERLTRAGIPPSHLELEVTESVFFGQIAEQVEATLRMVSEAGMTIALDDFGTGYASLTHLRQFPVDVIKIDQSFVASLGGPRAQGDDAIVKAVISLARSLKMDCVAEGVETVRQAEMLRDWGCYAAQGFLFSRAVAASRVPRLIDGLRSGGNGGRRIRSLQSVAS